MSCLFYMCMGVLLLHPLPFFWQHQLSLLADQCFSKQVKHGWYPATQSYGPKSSAGGRPEGGIPDGGGSSEAQPLPAVLQQYTFLAPPHPFTHCIGHSSYPALQSKGQLEVVTIGAGAGAGAGGSGAGGAGAGIGAAIVGCGVITG